MKKLVEGIATTLFVVYMMYQVGSCLMQTVVVPQPQASVSVPSRPTAPTRTEPLVAPSTIAPPQTAARVGSPIVIVEPTDSSEAIALQFTFEWRKREWTWDVTVPKSLYEYYRGVPRSPTRNYSVYVTHPLDDAVVDLLAQEIKEACAAEGYGEQHAVRMACAFVQSLDYCADAATTGYDEYPRYPVETLVDRGGDCEDTSILMAALLDTMGYGVVFIEFPGEHAAVGVLGEDMPGCYYEYVGGKYYYLETTGDGWDIGDMPAEYEDLSAYLYEMKSVPILTHDWDAQGNGYVANLTVEVANLGTADATNVSVAAGFDAGSRQVWNSVESDTFGVPAGATVTITFTLRAPWNEHTRLVIQIIQDGVAVDESYSEWFDT